MFQKNFKRYYLVVTSCFTILSFLSAQNPTYSSRIFYPTDATASFFSMSSTPLSILSDSSFISVGTLNQIRFISRFDKTGNHLWSRTHLNDSLSARLTYAKSSDGIFFLGLYPPPRGNTIPRIFLAKMDNNGNTIWSRVLSTSLISTSTTINFSANLTVSTNGSVLVNVSNGTNDAWQTSYALVNADGSLAKAWTFSELGRPTVASTLDGGFIIGSSIPAGGLLNGLSNNLRLIRLRANGDIQWTKYLSPRNAGTSLGSSLGRFIQLPDSSFAMIYGITVTRLTSSGTILWSNFRIYQATPGFLFSTSTLVNSSLMATSNNKIYTLTAALETSTIGIGRETPIINEYDVETGNVRALAYPQMTARLSSMVEVANNGGYWIMGDTIVPLGANMTRTVAARLMRTDLQFNAGCGAPQLLNIDVLSGNIIEAAPPSELTATTYDAQMYTPTTTTTFSPIVFNTKGECPSSIVATDEAPTALPILVYPNPSIGDFMIESEEADIRQLRVYDLAGRLVQTHNNIGRKHPLSIEQSGTYLLQIETDKGRGFKKIVKLK